MDSLSLIAVDLDGTLGGIGGVSVHCRDAMNSLRERGVKVALATARGIDEALVYRLGEYYGLDYLILEGGNIIFERQGETYERVVDWDEALKTEKEHLLTFRRKFLEAFQLTEEDGFRRLFAEPTTGRSFRVYWHHEAVQVCSEEGDRLLFSKVRKEIEAIVRENRLKVVLIDYPNLGTRVEVNAATKGDAIAFLVATMNQSPRSACAIGDSENDIGMMQVVGVPAAPANADATLKEVVKERGGILASEPGTRGVTQILRYLLSGNGPAA